MVQGFGPFFGFGLLLRTLLEAVIGTICFWHPSRPVIFGKPNVSRVVGSGHTDAYFRISAQLLHPVPSFFMVPWTILDSRPLGFLVVSKVAPKPPTKTPALRNPQGQRPSQQQESSPGC